MRSWLVRLVVALLAPCTTASLAVGAQEIAEAPLIVHQVVPDPLDPDRFYAITSNMGVLASTDGGRRWAHANRGLRSFTHHALISAVVPGENSPVLFAGGWGGGVSVSRDRAATWREINGDLGNTAIDALAVDPVDGVRLYAATSTGVFRSGDGGMRWAPFGEGLPPLSEAVGYKSLAVQGPPANRLWLGTEGGLFRRDREGGRWRADADLGSARVTAVTVDGRTGRVYVGTIKQGVYVGTGRGWRRVGDRAWFVSRIVVHPADSSRVFVATRGAGVFASSDAGRTWARLGQGLTDPDVRSLAIHPAAPTRLVAGTTASAFFYSGDGGASWHPADPVGRFTMSQITAMLDVAAPPLEPPAVPAAFAKCNRCHGWTDARLNAKPTYWRVPPNPRDWRPTVTRMAARAELTEAEREDLIRFLTSYSRGQSP